MEYDEDLTHEVEHAKWLAWYLGEEFEPPIEPEAVYSWTRIDPVAIVRPDVSTG